MNDYPDDERVVQPRETEPEQPAVFAKCEVCQHWKALHATGCEICGCTEAQT